MDQKSPDYIKVGSCLNLNPIVAYPLSWPTVHIYISAHYLFFSLVFLYAAPITFVLVPVALFAILHSASYSLTLLDTLGRSSRNFRKNYCLFQELSLKLFVISELT